MSLSYKVPIIIFVQYSILFNLRRRLKEKLEYKKGVNRKTDNTMATIKRTKRKTIIYITLHSTIKIQLSVLVQYKADLIIILLKINLFSLWYNWKIAELALNNNHSLAMSSGDKVNMQVRVTFPSIIMVTVLTYETSTIIVLSATFNF